MEKSVILLLSLFEILIFCSSWVFSLILIFKNIAVYPTYLIAACLGGPELGAPLSLQVPWHRCFTSAPLGSRTLRNAG